MDKRTAKRWDAANDRLLARDTVTVDSQKIDRILKYLGQQQDANGGYDQALHIYYYNGWVAVWTASVKN